MVQDRAAPKYEILIYARYMLCLYTAGRGMFW